jgi:D-alanyl-D-alanine carboxypeptidase/D-alanyl-D-alanine-endopeptidase (penicillin-binding protein 4)
MTKDGTVIFARDAEKAFMPASNMKLYTTAAAIDAFGPDFRLETSVYATRPIGRSGLLSGDLIFYGRGDPNLSARFEKEGDHSDFKPAELIPAIEALADQIKARGVKRINGDLIGDDSYYSSDLIGPGWEWDDAQFYYGAEISV